jgi:hypothetical protein
MGVAGKMATPTGKYYFCLTLMALWAATAPSLFLLSQECHFWGFEENNAAIRGRGCDPTIFQEYNEPISFYFRPCGGDQFGLRNLYGG